MQSFYAVLALGAFGLVALTAQRHWSRADTRVFENEIETIALGVAADQLNRAATLPFDSAGVVTSTDGLTAPADFGGVATWAGALDLDDLDGLAERRSVGPAAAPVDLEVNLEVRYVERVANGFVVATGKTPHKELRATITGALDRTVVLSRVYGCPFLGELRVSPPATP